MTGVQTCALPIFNRITDNREPDMHSDVRNGMPPQDVMNKLLEELHDYRIKRGKVIQAAETILPRIIGFSLYGHRANMISLRSTWTVSSEPTLCGDSLFSRLVIAEYDFSLTTNESELVFDGVRAAILLGGSGQEKESSRYFVVCPTIPLYLSHGNPRPNVTPEDALRYIEQCMAA